jgi:hypothetical protein
MRATIHIRDSHAHCSLQEKTDHLLLPQIQRCYKKYNVVTANTTYPVLYSSSKRNKVLVFDTFTTSSRDGRGESSHPFKKALTDTSRIYIPVVTATNREAFERYGISAVCETIRPEGYTRRTWHSTVLLALGAPMITSASHRQGHSIPQRLRDCSRPGSGVIRTVSREAILFRGRRSKDITVHEGHTKKTAERPLFIRRWCARRPGCCVS